MVEELGGPVWHASAMAPNDEYALALCRAALTDVGDAELGEWVEQGTPGTSVVHLKRRISAEEALLVGPIRDLRGTPELKARVRVLLAAAPALRPHVMRGLRDGDL